MVTDIDQTSHIHQPLFKSHDEDGENLGYVEDAPPIEGQAKPDPEHPTVAKVESTDQAGHQHKLDLTMAEYKHIYVEEVEKNEETEGLSVMGKISHFLLFPINFGAMILIPNVDPEKIDAWYTPIIPFTSMIGLITLLKGRNL